MFNYKNFSYLENNGDNFNQVCVLLYFFLEINGSNFYFSEINRRDFRAWFGLGQTYEVLRLLNYSIFYFKQVMMTFEKILVYNWIILPMSIPIQLELSQ